MNYKYSEDMKYLALYWALRFIEVKEDMLVKEYKGGYKVTIDAENQFVDFGNRITIIGDKKLSLTNHKSFVVLECVDKLLSMGYLPSEIIIDLQNEFDIYANNLYIKCFEWGHMDESNIVPKPGTFISIKYESRLVSGIIERKTEIRDGHDIFEYGIFELKKKQKSYQLRHKNSIKTDNKDFVIEDDVFKKYNGSEKKVLIPEGIKAIRSCAFWDNQSIEEVVLPESLVSLGGDTFYNCKNLKKIVIPSKVEEIANNPFAGCPVLKLENKSKNFKLVDGVLFDKKKTILIYYSISKKNEKYKIPSSVSIIGKHSFFMADNLKEVIIPSSVRKLENNPFSGCSKLEAINKSSYINIINKVIYNRYKTTVLGCINSIETDELILEPVKSIGRNAFWNCKGIKKIVLPTTLKQIGYNPFIGCSNIRFESHTDEYVVENDILFDKNKNKIVCYPSWKAIGEVYIPESVIALERGAFSGCNKMTGINLHNVNVISKSCFTNCSSLKAVYCSDSIKYIGEWAFAYCSSLKSVSISSLTTIDNNAFANCEPNISIREQKDNYVIESDNLFTLMSLSVNYRGKIDSIVIDPPYNSNIDYIGYKDSNYENGYISFMRERLVLAYQLLSDKGFLIINIDDGEFENLKKLCEEIFGGDLVSTHKWKKKHPFFDTNRVVLNPNKVQTDFENIIVCRKTKDAILNKIHQPYIKNDVIKEKVSDFPNIFDCFGTTSSAKDEINELFGTRDYFSTPKPVKLIKEFVRATTNKNSIILDFFAGSGTLGQAVQELNNEDGGTRSYILVSNNESNICKNVTLKRMKIVDNRVIFID